MSLIIPANTLASGGFSIDNSCRFNSGSSDYLVRTMDSAPTLATKATISYWFKRTKLDAWGGMGGYSASSGTGTNNFQIGFNDANYGYFWQNSPALYFYTSAVNRDPSAWKNVVISIDTTQGTASNRVKYYENGIRTTSFVTETYPSQNDALNVNKNGNLFSVGRFTSTGGSQFYYDGYFAEVAFVDGLALAPTDFGEFDEDSGIWKPISVSGLTFGNNGFYLDFEDSAALGADVSGNTNNFTVNNLTAIDQTTDTPTNNFATLNSLDNFYAQATFSNGNLTVVTPVSQYAYIRSTIAASSGKWYAELKITTASAADNQHGIVSDAAINSTGGVGERANAYGYRGSGQVVSGGSVVSYTAASYTAGDIISIAMDLDNNLIFFYKNGAIQNSGTGLAITAPASTTDGVYYFATSDNANLGGGTYQFDWNFGSPPYSESGGETDGNGYGNFAHAVPSGYYSANTKNLSEYG